jgi:hypothetical protein
MTNSPDAKANIFKENRTSRLTVLIDPQKKKAFEELCERLDTTPSQAIRQMIRDLLLKYEINWPVPESDTNGA